MTAAIEAGKSTNVGIAEESQAGKAKIAAEEDKLAKELSDLQRTVETEKQRVQRRVTDQVKLIYQ